MALVIFIDVNGDGVVARPLVFVFSVVVDGDTDDGDAVVGVGGIVAGDIVLLIILLLISVVYYYCWCWWY